MNRWVAFALLLILAGAVALRSFRLAHRPLHNDEAVNAIKIKGLWEGGRYVYDPNEHHGPTLYYATLPVLWLSGARGYDLLSEPALRATCVFWGALLVLLPLLLARGTGWPAALVAALLTALSPAMVYYSRDFIHEVLLVFSTAVAIVGGWRYSQQPGWGWAALTGAGLGLMYATKETFVLAGFAMILGLALSVAWGRWLEKTPWPRGSPVTVPHALAGLGVAAVVALVFFTSFFTNAAGPLDSVRTYVPWLRRAGGDSPHIHPWYFYLERLVWFKSGKGPVWTEGLIVLLAVVGGGAALAGRAVGHLFLARFLTFYTLLLTAVYSLISYKTPWCMLGFLHGLILLAALGVGVLISAARGRAAKAALVLLLAAGAGHLGWQAWRASYPFAADPRNPYVYAQTVPDLLRLVERVKGLSRVHSDQRQMLIKVMSPESDYWPLPWYLRQFDRVGWWDRLPADPFAPVMIVGAQFKAALDDKSDKKWLMAGYFELRPKTFLELYVQFELWEKYVQSLPPSPDE